MRLLSAELEAALAHPERRPAYRLLAFDATLDDYTAIVTETYTQEPLDLTAHVSQINWSQGQISFILKDEAGEFHPDTGQHCRYLADGSIFRLREGDARVPEAEWPWTFTGALKGQLGWMAGPRGGARQAQVTAYGREHTQAYKRRQITSAEYTAGTDLGVVLHDLAETFLGLEPIENLIPAVLGVHLAHRSNQIVQLPPWEALSAVLEVVSGVPTFNGEGKLYFWSKNLSRAPDRLLPDYVRVYEVRVEGRSQDVVNKIIVEFLHHELEQVDGPTQKLGQASVTTGFFTFRERLPCYWSEDRRQRAHSTWMKVIKSVNDNLLPVGKESYEENDIFHGTITIEIYWWVPVLATVLLLDYVASHMIHPDYVITDPITGSGVTIPVGRTAAALDLIGILLIMMSLGSAQYEVWGIPYDLVYPLKRAIAVTDGLEYWEEIDKEIANDFIATYDRAEAVAVNEWVWEQSAARPRTVVLDDDLALEVGDIIELADGRRYFVQNLSKQIQRGKVPQLTVQAFQVAA
jgi:hypothetical protein